MTSNRREGASRSRSAVEFLGGAAERRANAALVTTRIHAAADATETGPSAAIAGGRYRHDPAEQPGAMPIEPRIRPLVEALNGTGLVQTFTSCEGHFDDPPARGPDRQQANAGFFLRKGVPEERLARLFGAVLATWRLRGGDGVELTISKHYVPALDGTDVPEVFFEFTIRPSDLGSACDVKRRLTDRCLAIVTRAVAGRDEAAAQVNYAPPFTWIVCPVT